MWLAPYHLQALTHIQTSTYYALQCAITTQIKLPTLAYYSNFTHVISMQSSGAYITLSGPGSGLTYPTTSGFGRILKNDNYMNIPFLETA